VRWVDTNKSDKKKPEYTCRLVTKQIKKDKREDLFAATPQLQAKHALFSWFAEMRSGLIDVGRGYPCEGQERNASVDPPKEDCQEETCGNFKNAMCGTRDAAQSWEPEHTEMMV
jgi:hypothetical protein